ncbi:uncharacterized protein LOC129214633 isoform X2 [Grus americana]|uniref:uncharacterized protein LOC129214633 isoform X2 n=1 Tax=Grus americana TaxID=9117 RepID=UPI0024081A89|nr:uncharacterized protein LOC129214633 isoform X2 [Grus americana]XP_054702575.1 uncharacterized protein LOC129214633 isoform X2 [Grus americana]
MDCPRFTRLCFLILTVAAPHPNIAMPSDNCAEGRQDKPNVTVYHCKDCESNICESSNYEDFVKISETQSETFSNEIIQLVTNETHIIMCFQQEGTVPEGIYAIFWEKAMGAGDSCGGIVEAVGSSENVTFDTAKICCGAETDPSLTKHPLKCYTETSGEKNGKSPANITGYRQTRDPCSRQANTNPLLGTVFGDAQFSVYEKSCISIIILVLILGFCAAALATYCVRRNRKGQGPVIVLHQIFNGIGKAKGTPDVENLTPFRKKIYK